MKRLTGFGALWAVCWILLCGCTAKPNTLVGNYVYEQDGFGGTFSVKVTRVIRTCFKKADFRSPVVKILANTGVLAPFCALAEQKSALFKIFDRKARRFRGIFVLL